MLYATAKSPGGSLHDIATIVSVVGALAIVLVLASLLLTGRSRIFKFSLKDLAVEMSRPGSSEELAAAIAAISDPAAAMNYTSYAQSIVQAAIVPSRLDALYIDVARQPGWLTSRLFFMVALLERMRGLRSVVFVESNESGATRFVGLATPGVVRWLLARLYPWLDEAFAVAYAQLSDGDPDLLRYRPTSSSGALGVDAVSHLLTPYLQKLQKNQEHDPGHGEWTRLNAAPITWERAIYVRRAEIENLLGEDLKRPTVRHDLPHDEKIKAVLLHSGDFVAAVDAEQRLHGLVDRRRWIEESARYVARHSTQIGNIDVGRAAHALPAVAGSRWSVPVVGAFAAGIGAVLLAGLLLWDYRHPATILTGVFLAVFAVVYVIQIRHQAKMENWAKYLAFLFGGAFFPLAAMPALRFVVDVNTHGRLELLLDNSPWLAGLAVIGTVGFGAIQAYLQRSGSAKA